MNERKKNTLIGLAIGAVMIAFIVGLNLWNFRTRMEREAYDSDTLYHNFRVAAETKYGGYGELPYLITKEEEPVLVYFGYAAYEEEGYYEIYVLSGKYADDHLWNGPVAKGEVALREGSKTIEVDAQNKEKYQVTISVTEDGKSEIKIEQIS